MVKLLLLLLLTGPVFAKTEREIGFGSYSYHLLGDAKAFSQLENKVSSDGKLIQNTMLTYKITSTNKEYYSSDAFFGGENSVASAMFGYLGASGAYVNKYTQVGFVYGAYVQDNTKFLQKDIVNPYSFFSESKINIVPVFGLEVNFKAKISKDYFIKLNNVITPAVTNHTVSFGVEF